MLGTEIRKRLLEAVQREGLSLDHERMAVPVVNAIVPEVSRLINEETRALKAKIRDLESQESG